MKKLLFTLIFFITIAASGQITADSTATYISLNGKILKVVGAAAGGTWGSITGTLSNQTDLQGVLNDKIDIDAGTPRVAAVWGPGTKAEFYADYPYPSSGFPVNGIAFITDSIVTTTAADIINVPSGNLIATDVQAALNELQTELDGAGGGSESTTVSDTGEIDLTLTTFDITADIVTASIDETKLDVSTNASLDLADTSVQNGGALGTPSSGTLTNVTGLVASTGLTATGTKDATTVLHGDDTWKVLGAASLPVSDATSIVEGSVDNTKEVRIEADGLTTSTVRVWTAQDADLTVAGTNIAQSWTGIQSFQDDVRLDNSNHLDMGISGSYFGEDYAISGQRWRIAKDQANDQIEFAYQSTAQTTATGGVYNDIYTLAASGTPTNTTDLTDKAYVDGLTDNIAVSALADGTDGELITWDATGAPATVAAGTATQVLTSNGPGAAPTFQVAPGGGNVSLTGTPVNNQLAIWTDGTTIEGDGDVTYDGTDMTFDNGGAIGPALEFVSTFSADTFTFDQNWLNGSYYVDWSRVGGTNWANQIVYGVDYIRAGTTNTIDLGVTGTRFKDGWFAGTVNALDGGSTDWNATRTDWKARTNNTTTLVAITEASIADGAAITTITPPDIYIYDAGAVSGDFAPTDQTGGTGYWILKTGGYDPTQDVTLDDGTTNTPEFRLTNTFDTSTSLMLDLINGFGYFGIEDATLLLIGDALLRPATTNVFDLGIEAQTFKDGFFSGIVYTGSLDLAPTDTPPTDGEGRIYSDDSENALKFYDGTAWKDISNTERKWDIPLGAVGADLVVADDLTHVPVHDAITITRIEASVLTAPTGAGITIDIELDDGTPASIFSTLLTIDATERFTSTAATAAVISDATIPADSFLTFNVDVIGSTIAGSDATVTIYYTID